MRVVIKVGTSLIAPGGQIDVHLLRGLVDQFPPMMCRACRLAPQWARAG
jgi:hypothetical protein